MSLTIHVVPCRGDNYAYLVVARGQKCALVVDAVSYQPVAAEIERRGLQLVAVLSTHHHYDHVGGNEQLAAEFSALTVYAHESDRGRVPAQNKYLRHDQQFEVGGLQVRTLHVPGHTRGSVAYVIDDAVFTGDTLFVAGCGRLFEGNAQQLHDSLNTKLGSLPSQTRVFCGHEYTCTNLRFALSVEPDNEAVRHKLEGALERTERGEPTVPSTIEQERDTNPFLRCDQPAITRRFSGKSEAEVFAALRRAKDAF